MIDATDLALEIGHLGLDVRFFLRKRILVGRNEVFGLGRCLCLRRIAREIVGLGEIRVSGVGE
ncbi:hypothetical protein D3C73_517860 [compost metagenome]